MAELVNKKKKSCLCQQHDVKWTADNVLPSRHMDHTDYSRRATVASEETEASTDMIFATRQIQAKS